jgi:hypothetical protein
MINTWQRHHEKNLVSIRRFSMFFGGEKWQMWDRWEKGSKVAKMGDLKPFWRSRLPSLRICD